MKNKILFVKIASFSHVNSMARQKLHQLFPGYEIKTIDVLQILRSKKIYIVFNYLFILKEYFSDLVTNKKKIKEYIISNSYFFSLIKRKLLEEYWQDSIAFTFQTQSLFDASLPGIPNYVLTDNTALENQNNPYFNKNKTPSAKWLRFEKSIFVDAAKIFVMSSNVTRSLVEQYSIPAKKIYLVHAGGNVKEPDFNSVPKDYSSKNIIFIGGNWIRKGGPTLLKAFESIYKIHPDATLTIVSWRAPKINHPGIKVFGKISLKEIAELLSKASIYCMPSIIEPFGFVFIEALMNRLPIVATRINAIPDFVVDGENGFLVQPKNVEQLVNALLKLLDSSELCRKFGERGYKTYAEKFNWDSTFDKIKNEISTDLTDDKKIIDIGNNPALRRTRSSQIISNN